ncbi:lipopolysaccharide heptosyltransferase II [Massilia sp. W12]|uniref:lipopolysaccharide heptosyltransferase II n=1 Tax=Massilia sp. W12 TaxID=3126507 RepID=UPI0030CDAC9E
MSGANTELHALTQRILIISPNWIGDAVMAQPLLRLLKDAHPERSIDVLCPPSAAAVWRAMAEVEEVVETPFRHGALQLRERWQLAQVLRKRGYLEAYVLPNTLKYALIPWLAGIPRRIGYKGESRYGLLNVMHHDDGDAPRAMVPFYAALATPPAPQAPPLHTLPRPRLTVGETEIKRAMGFAALQPNWPVVVFAPGAEFGSAKRWPARHFAELAGLVWQTLPYAQVILLGSKKDMAVCEKIVAIEPRVRNLAGLTQLSDAIHLIANAVAVVSNDSGLMHIASALNRPVLALYGPTDPDHAPPFSDVAKALSLRLACAPCRERRCPLGHRECMRKMTADFVYQEFKPMLQSAAEQE